jgi:hypothetical protein
MAGELASPQLNKLISIEIVNVQIDAGSGSDALLIAESISL